MRTAKRRFRWGALGVVASTVRASGTASFGTRLLSIPRMLWATLTGRYSGISRGHLFAMVFAAAYIVWPLDLIPEAIFLLPGLIDDAVVASWLAVTLIRATDDFLDFERTRYAVRGQTVS